MTWYRRWISSSKFFGAVILMYVLGVITALSFPTSLLGTILLLTATVLSVIFVVLSGLDSIRDANM